MDLKALCFQVQEHVLDTAKMIRKERQNFDSIRDVEKKGHSNFVTHIDKLAEEKLVKHLAELLPEAGFIAEEGTSDKSGETYNWVIDPIDGTTNFIHGLSPHAICVGLMKNDKPILGVVYEIPHDEMFYAWQGSAAFLNNKEISVSAVSEHQDALIATGFPYYDLGKLDKYIESMKEVMAKTGGVRRLGSAAIDICYIACGRFEAFWEYGLHAWDVVAASFILQQAGGKLSDFNGGEDYIFGEELIATNSNYFNKFYEIVNPYLGKKS